MMPSSTFLFLFLPIASLFVLACVLQYYLGYRHGLRRGHIRARLLRG